MGKKSQKKKNNPPPEVPSTTHWSKMRKWCLGSIVGVILVGIIVNQISDILPNPLPYILRSLHLAAPKRQVWYAARLENGLDRELSFLIWKYKKPVWYGDTLQPGEVKAFCDTGPLFVMMQGDFFAELGPNNEVRHFTHSYRGTEAYELVATRFPIEPNQRQLDDAPKSTIERVVGATPTVLKFYNSPNIPFLVTGPDGHKLRTEIPTVANGDLFYPFQASNNKK